MSEHSHTQADDGRAFSTRRRTLVACAAIFLVAFGVRALHWQDNRHGFPFEGMAGEYQNHATTLVEGKLDLFLRGPDPPSDANYVKHPPGYPLLLAAVYEIFGTSDAAVRTLHVALDSAAAVLVLLVAAELFPFGVAVLAGLLVALSPQLAYHSITLVPDPLAAPPLLLAFYFLVRATKRPRLVTLLAAGALVGVSCWLRSNALLLAPFLALLSPVLFERGRRLRSSAALVGACVLVIAPVTVRNAVVYKSFIPLSLSAGITLVEGIGIYDREGKFGLPSSDYNVTKWEAEMYGRPDYLGTRFDPDGVERERRRVGHGLRVIRENPRWFLGVMAHRAASMFRLARVEVIAAGPPVTRPLDVAEGSTPAWAVSPQELSEHVNAAAVRAELLTSTASTALRFEGDAAGTLIASPPFAVRRETDYLLRLPLKIEEGSVVVEVVDARDGSTLASTAVLHPVNWLDLTPDTQPAVDVARPFVSGDADEVRVVLRNGSQRPARVVAAAGRVEAFALGPAAYTWTRHPRMLVRAVQKLFLTACVLPFIVVGIALLARARRWRALAILLALPAYYVCTQSALWTEFRYVLAMHYFLLILAAFGLHAAAKALWGVALKLKS